MKFILLLFLLPIIATAQSLHKNEHESLDVLELVLLQNISKDQSMMTMTYALHLMHSFSWTYEKYSRNILSEDTKILRSDYFFKDGKNQNMHFLIDENQETLEKVFMITYYINDDSAYKDFLANLEYWKVQKVSEDYVKNISTWKYPDPFLLPKSKTLTIEGLSNGAHIITVKG